MTPETLSLHLVLDPARAAECAAELQTRLRPGQFHTLCRLAAEILSRHEAQATGSMVLVVPSHQAAAVAADLGAPGLDRAADRLRRRHPAPSV